MKKLLLSVLFFMGLWVFPSITFAQNIQSPEDVFEARVTQITDTKNFTDKDGTEISQQNLKLKGVNGIWKNKDVDFIGISDVEVFGSNTYYVGDRVIVQHSIDPDGKDIYYVQDYVRRPWLYALAALFALLVIAISGKKGIRAIISLIVSFFIIMRILIPLVLAGWSPIPVAIAISILIFICMVYITEGINRKSNLAILSIGISLLLVGLLSLIVTSAARLTGTAQEETMFLVGLTDQALNFKGLLLAGILIGTLGVLDDIVIGQIESVTQIKNANPNLPWRKVFSMAMQVGNAHLGSMVNTLFLAYTGVSLPLLLLFGVKQAPFMTFTQAINNEIIATEIIRTLIGSIGIAVSLPLATFLAVRFLGPVYFQAISRK